MKQYIVDAFTDKIFSGNPAAVCVLDNFPSEEIMQSIAAENNLSETAFFVKENDRYHIRWFTPKSEIDFCGHATLATAFQAQFLSDLPTDSIGTETSVENILNFQIVSYYDMRVSYSFDSLIDKIIDIITLII